MSLDLLFTITFPVVVPFWALMILAPWWRADDHDHQFAADRWCRH